MTQVLNMIKCFSYFLGLYLPCKLFAYQQTCLIEQNPRDMIEEKSDVLLILTTPCQYFNTAKWKVNKKINYMLWMSSLYAKNNLHKSIENIQWFDWKLHQNPQPDT